MNERTRDTWRGDRDNPRQAQDGIHQGPPEHDSMSLAEQASYELAPDATHGGCSCC